MNSKLPDYETPKHFEIHGGTMESVTNKSGEVVERIFRTKVVVNFDAKNPEDLGFLMRREDKLRLMDAIRIYER